LFHSYLCLVEVVFLKLHQYLTVVSESYLHFSDIYFKWGTDPDAFMALQTIVSHRQTLFQLLVLAAMWALQEAALVMPQVMLSHPLYLN
jgi:hypothetical protein